MDLPWISRLISQQIQQKSGSNKAVHAESPQNQELLRGILNGSPELQELKLSDIASLIPQIKAELSQYLLAQLDIGTSELAQGSTPDITQLLKQIIDSHPAKNSQTLTQIVQQWTQKVLPQQPPEIQNQTVKQLTQILQPLVSQSVEPQVIQSQVKEFLGLLEQNKLEAIKTLPFPPPKESPDIGILQTLSPALKASSQSELQSLVQNFSPSPQLPENLAQLLQTLSQGQKVPLELEQPKVFVPQELKQQEPTNAIVQAVENILTKIKTLNPANNAVVPPNIERQLWTLYPIQPPESQQVSAMSSDKILQALLTPPIDPQLLKSPTVSPQEIKLIHESAQIPPTFRSIKDFEFLIQTFKESLDRIPKPQENQGNQETPPPTQNPVPIEPQLFKEFHQLNYLLETKLPASESPSPVEQEKLLLSLLNLKQSQGLQELSPDLLQKIFNKTSLSEWVQNPSSLLPKLQELPQQVSQALLNLFTDKPILDSQELTRSLTQLISQQPELKELPIIQRLEHFTQWNQLEQEKSADAPKEQSIYWTNGEELIHSKIQVQDEREKTKNKADEPGTQSLVLYTQAPTLGDITAKLKRVRQDSDELNLTIEDSTGAYSQAFEEEKVQFEQDLLSIGFELQNFVYKARLLKPLFTPPHTTLKTSEIDLQA